MRSERPRSRLFRPEPRDVRPALSGRRAGPVRLGGQINPSKTKPNQTNPSKIAWICLVLFGRIGTFQWVRANPNKKILLSQALRKSPQAAPSHFVSHAEGRQ